MSSTTQKWSKFLSSFKYKTEAEKRAEEAERVRRIKETEISEQKPNSTYQGQPRLRPSRARRTQQNVITTNNASSDITDSSSSITMVTTPTTSSSLKTHERFVPFPKLEQWPPVISPGPDTKTRHLAINVRDVHINRYGEKKVTLRKLPIVQVYKPEDDHFTKMGVQERLPSSQYYGGLMSSKKDSDSSGFDTNSGSKFVLKRSMERRRHVDENGEEKVTYTRSPDQMNMVNMEKNT